MIITHHGKQHYKLTLGDTTIAINPQAKGQSIKNTKYGADIALITLNTPSYNGIENVTHGDKSPYVISGPGEYEIGGIFIKGFGSTINYEEGKKVKKMQNTSYVFTFDNIRVVFLGQIQQALAPEHKSIIDETDILFVPVGGDGVSLNPYDAHKLATSLEAKLIIPMESDEKLLPTFLKEAGAENVTGEEKLTIKRKDLEGKEGEVFILYES